MLSTRGWKSVKPARSASALGTAPQRATQQGRNFLRRQRTAEDITLHDVALLFDDDRELGAGLHPFGDHAQAQRMRHRDDRRDDLGIFLVLVNLHNEAAIDLERVDGEAPQIAER